MAWHTNSKLEPQDFLGIASSIGYREAHSKMLLSVGFGPTSYYILAKAKSIFLQRPSKELRETFDISRATEWRYRKKLKNGGYL